MKMNIFVYFGKAFHDDIQEPKINTSIDSLPSLDSLVAALTSKTIFVFSSNQIEYHMDLSQVFAMGFSKGTKARSELTRGFDILPSKS